MMPPDFRCYLCGSGSASIRKGHARDDEMLVPLECNQCGLVRLSSFDHITNSFYSDSHMHDCQPCDPELELRQNAEDTQRRFSQFKDILAGKNLLDIGCGAGGFLLKARSISASVVGVEPERRLFTIFNEKKLDVYLSIEAVPTVFKPDIITMFHVLEHIPDPLAMLIKIRNRFFSGANRGGRRVIIEVPNASDALLTLYSSDEFSRFTYWSCHLYLFTENNLETLGGKAGFKAVKVMQYQRYPLANHLYWLAKGKPGGHIVWDFLNRENLMSAYADALSSHKACDTIIGIFS